MRQLHIDEWQSTVLSQPVGLDPQRCLDRSTSLKIHKNWSFSGQDYTIKDADGNVLLKSYGSTFVFRQYIITSIVSEITDHLNNDLYECTRTLPDAHFNVYTPHPKDQVSEVSLGFSYENEQGGMGSRTLFKDRLTGMNKQIVIDWNDIYKKRGLICLRDDCGHDGTNDKLYGTGLPIGWLNDYETAFDIVNPQIDMTANVDYALLAITAICSESLTE